MSSPIEKGKRNLTAFSRFIDGLSLKKNGCFGYKNAINLYDIFEIRQAFEWVKSHNNRDLELEGKIEQKIGLLQEALHQESLKIRRLSPFKGILSEQKFSVPIDDCREFSFLDPVSKNIDDTGSSLENSDNHLFAHLHLGTKALGTGFEGGSIVDVLDWSKDLLGVMQNPEIANHLLPVHGAENLKKPIEQLSEVSKKISCFRPKENSHESVALGIKEVAEEIGSSIKNLASGESYLMPGGYTAFPGGHAIYYRFTREENGSFTIVLYNAGKGANWQNQLEEQGILTKVCPYVVFSGLIQEELFSESGKSFVLFETLLELMILPKQFRMDSSCRFGIEDVWRAFFPLHHRQIDTSKYKPLFMTLQRSGTCAQKSLNACFLDLLPDPNAYKALNFNSQILSLLKFYAAHADRLSDSSSEMNRVRFQLKEATVHLFQKLLRYAQGKKDVYPELTKEQFKSYIGTFQELSDRLNIAENFAIEAFQGEFVEEKLSKPPVIFPVLRELNNLAFPEHFSPPKQILSPLFPEIKVADPEDVGQIAKSLRFLPVSSEVMLSLIERFFGSFPLPIANGKDPFWSKVPLDLDLLKNISALFRHYIDQSSQEKPLHTLRQFNAVFSAYAAMDQLCRRYDKELAQGLLENYSVAITPFEKLLEKDSALLLENFKEWERLTALFDYFKSRKKNGKEIFNYTQIRSLESPPFQAEKELYAKVGESYPNRELCERFLQRNRESGLSDEELYAYDALNQGWMAGNEHSWLDLLSETNNQHIAVFKQLAFDLLVAFDTQGVRTSNAGISGSFSRNHFQISNLGRTFNLNEENSSLNKAFGKGGESAWKGDELKFIRSGHFSKYFSLEDSLISEGEHLQEISKLDQIGKRRGGLVGALCHRESAVSTLLYRMERDPLLMADPAARVIVQRILFRPYIFLDDKSKIPLFEEIKERPEIFLKQARDVVKRGFQQSLYARTSEHADLDAALFFVQFAQQIEASYKKIHGRYPEPRLYSQDVFEKLEGASRQKKTATPLLAAVCLLKLNDLINEGDPNSWQTDHWKQVYQNRMLLSTLSGVEQLSTVDPRLFESVSAKMRDLEQPFYKAIENGLEDFGDIFDGISSVLGLDDGISFWQQKKETVEHGKWNVFGNTLTFQSSDGLKINLSKPTVATEKGEFQLMLASVQSKAIKKVFGDRLQIVQNFGKEFQFYDSLYGLCRISRNGEIQRKIGRSWYLYVAEKFFEKYARAKEIPMALLGGYIHWIEVNPNKGICERSRLRITDQESGQEHPLYQKELLQPLANQEEKVLTRFEEKDYLLCWETRIEMPRYRAKMGGCLAFVKKEGDLLYAEDPGYHLEKAPLLHSLGHFTNFLLLHDPKKKRQKCLIPKHKIVSSGFSSEAKIERPSPSVWENQNQICSYFEFSVEEGELVADGGDGWLYLAQIYLAQKDYLRAGRCLDKITKSDQLTDEAKALFQGILLSGSSSKDYSPNACALRLRAFWILKALDPLTKGYEELFGDPEHRNIHDVYRFYLKSMNSVYEPLRLSRSMEKELIRFFGSFEKRERFLTNQSWEDIQISFTEKPSKDSGSRLLKEWDVEAFIKELKRKESNSYVPERFLYYYTRFKNSSDPEERNALAYRLQWRPIKSQFPNDRELLYFVYKYPELCPEFVKKDKRFFAEKLIEVFEKHSPSLSKEIHAFSESRPVHMMEKKSEEISRSVRLKEKSVKTPLVSVSPATEWDIVMKNFGGEYLEKKTLLPLKKIEPKCDFSDLNENEKPYGSVIKNAFEGLSEELEKGRKRLQEEQPFTLKEGKEEALREELEKFEQQMSGVCNSFEKEALLLCAKVPEGELKKLLGKEGYKSKKVTMTDLARIALLGVQEKYRSVAPYLSPCELQNLHSLVLEYLVAKTTYDHILRVLSLIKSASHPEISEVEKKSLLAKAAKILAMQRQYEPENNISALFFEYVSGLRLRKEQAVLFDQLIHKIINGSSKGAGIVFQMIQAGGKSSVILSRLMEFLSDQGRLPVFVCHHSQMQSAIGNMKRYQQERFEKNVIPIDYAEDQLKELTVLKHILNTIRGAKKNKDSILMSSRFVQILEGRLLLLLRQRRCLLQEEETQRLDKEITTLQEINQEILENGAALLDEMDLSLNIFQQVNIPTGTRRPLPTNWIVLAQKIFQVLSREEIEKFLHLAKNEQSNFSLEDYYKLVLPEVGCMLIREVPSLKLTHKQEGAFLRYLRRIDSKIEKIALAKEESLLGNLSREEKEDVEFLRYLHQTLRASSDLEQQEAAKQIALARGFICKLLPLTLTKVYNKDYGPDPKMPGKMIPYNGVGSPTDAEFGNIFEWLCYVLQSAINAPLSEAVISLYAEKMIRLANAQISPSLTFDRTSEAEAFQKMTGIALAQVFDGDNLKKAMEAVNKDSQHRLNIFAELAQEFVACHSEFIAMNPISMVDQFFLSIGTSGTLGNVNSYDSRLTQPILDEGAEGKILCTLLDRFDGKGKEIKPVDVRNLEQFIEASLQLVPDEGNHCFIDGEGCLTKFSGEEVAREILNYFSQCPKSKIEAVVYYQMSKEGKEGFVLLKKGSSEPIFLQDLSKEEIQKHGLSVNQIFYSLDELRATGTDPLMPSKANGVGTVGVSELRKLSQMVMRLRELFDGQDMQLVVSQSTHESVLGKSGTLLNLIEKSLKLQAIQSAEETMRSAKQQISCVIRAMLKREILKSGPERASLIEKDFAPFFETANPEDPFEMFAFSEEEKTAGEILRKQKNYQLNLFVSCAKKNPQLFAKKQVELIYQQAEERMDREILRLEKFPELQCLFADTSNSMIGSQVQVQIDQNILQQNQVAVSLELDEELRSYQANFSQPVFTEIDWDAQALDPWQPHKLGPQIYGVSHPLKDVDFDNGWVKRKGLYRKDYSSCFPSHINMTENLQKTLAGKSLSFFHPLQKHASALLLRKKEGGEFESIFLSQKDLNFWITQKKMPKGVWLLNPNGVPLVETKQRLLEEKIVRESLWYLNFFNGNISNLMKDGEHTSYFMKSNPLRKHFLALKVAENPEQRHLLETSPLFSEQAQISMRQAEKIEEERLEVEKMPVEQLSDLPPEKVSYVSLEKVPLLSKKEQIQALTAKQLDGLIPAQVNLLAPYQVADLQKPELVEALQESSLIKHVSLKAAQFLTTEQKKRHPLGIRELKNENEICALKDPEQIFFLTKEQAQYVLPKQVPYLNLEVISVLGKPEQIEALQGKKQINAIGLGAVSLLSEAQVALLTDPVLVRTISPTMIQYISPAAVGLLDVKRQLPFITKEQYAYINERQYREISELWAFGSQDLPKPLQRIWSVISPDALSIYKQILGQVELYNEIGEEKFNLVSRNNNFEFIFLRRIKKMGPKRKGETEWAYYLRLLKALKETDYLKVHKIRNERCGYVNYIPVDKILACKNLIHLELEACDLNDNDDLFSPHCSLPKLECLDLIRCDMNQVPSFFKHCTSLKSLFISDSTTNCKLPDWIYELKSLKSLRFYGTRIEEISPDIKNLENLEEFGCDSSMIRELPNELMNLKNMKSLTFQNNLMLQQIPESFRKHALKNNIQLWEHSNGKTLLQRSPNLGQFAPKETIVSPKESKVEEKFVEFTQASSFKKKWRLFEELHKQHQKNMPRSRFVDWCRQGPAPSAFFSKIADLGERVHRWWISLSLESGRFEESEKIARTLYCVAPEIQKQKSRLEDISEQMQKGTLTFEKLSQEEKYLYLDWVQEPQAQFLMHARKEAPDKVLTNLFLDKGWVMTSVEQVEESQALNEKGIYGMLPHTAGAMIGAGLRKLEEGSRIKELVPTIEQATLWSYLMQRKEGIGVVADQFMDKFSKMKVGDRLLLPVGTLDHHFLVQIRQKAQGKCEFNIVNTGAGLEKHPRFGDLRKFQTAITYENVPLEDLQNPTAWKEILDQLFDRSKDVIPIYEKLEKLAKNGYKKDPSKNVLDYSTAQLQGTCSAAPWWAWLRHEIVTFTSEGKEQNLLSAHTIWRVLKHQMKQAISSEVSSLNSSKPSELIKNSCLAKIEKQGQQCALLKICESKERFNEAMKELSEIFKQISGKGLLFAEQDYDSYPNDAARWKKLYELGKKLANEIFYLDENVKKKLLERLSKGREHLTVSYLTFLDFQETKKHLEILFEDAEKKNKWSLIGKTLGRLALDPKLGVLAVDLAKQWLIHHEVKEQFLYFITRGKGQERTLRHLAIYFRERNRALARTFWVEHRKYSGETLNTLISEGLVSMADLELIEETPMEIAQITSLIFAMRALPFDERAEKLLGLFVKKVLVVDDENHSHLRQVTQLLFDEGFEQMGHTIVQLRNAFSKI